MKHLCQLLIIPVLMLSGSLLQADALVQSRAAWSTHIAQYYVTDEGVRVELEIGVSALEGFRNLLPDNLYRELGFGEEPEDRRQQAFFSRELAIIADGEYLPGELRRVEPSRRILRDVITGEPLPVQEGAPQVLRCELLYPFEPGERPQQLTFTSPFQQDIGFVVYHRGVAVNDFRYLVTGHTLLLDWEDPWYSRFSVRNLKRQYSEPMSGFIYVENFEVRKEIIVRPKDLQRWVDLGLEGRTDIPVEIQGSVKEKVADFLSRHHPVTIDGEVREGILESVNFLERTLTSSRVVDPPVPLDVNSAIIGTIFVYPRSGLPQKVTMDWDLWDERIKLVPTAAVDEAGPLPIYLEPDWARLEWTNFLKNPYVPSLADVELPVEAWREVLHALLPLLSVLALSALVWTFVSRRRQSSVALPLGLFLAFVAASAAALQFGASNEPDERRARAIVADLLHNIYRAFDYREESDVYDVLERSVSGELLTDIFLETKRSLVLANQGGARARVKEVVLDAVTTRPDDGDDSFSVEAAWTVHGSVGHWGHIHKRSNRYLALLQVGVDGGRWKLRDMSVLQEERL